MYDAKDSLAKVLIHYGIIEAVESETIKIVCPFHEDMNPSMIVDFNENRFYCFGCQKSGDAQKFVYFMENKRNPAINDLMAYKLYLKIIGGKCNDNYVEIRHQIHQRASPSNLLDMAHDYYYGLKKIDWRPNSLIAEVNDVKEYMGKRGFSHISLNKCGAKVNYSADYGLIFPMLDNGKFKGWVCRTMKPEVEAKRKYLYNKGFSRRTTLVGNYGSKDYVFVVEGYMDMLKFVQFGVTNVVAILGWKISDGQVEELRKAGVSYVISALDNDDCGKRGTRYLSKIFHMFRFRYLKGVKDPGEMTEDNFLRMYRKTMHEYKIYRHKEKKNKWV